MPMMWTDRLSDWHSHGEAGHFSRGTVEAMPKRRQRWSTGLWVRDQGVHQAAVKRLNANNAAFWQQHEWTEEPSKKINPSLAEINRRNHEFWGER